MYSFLGACLIFQAFVEFFAATDGWAALASADLIPIY